MQDRRLDRRGRRTLLRGLAGSGLLGAIPRTPAVAPSGTRRSQSPQQGEALVTETAISLFLCGDVMTGRAVDQVLPHPGDPPLYEPYVRDAQRYVQLAEAINGPIGDPVDFAAIWGDALDPLEQLKPDVRLVNLATAISVSNTPAPAKGIHYRMHPKNLPAVRAAGIHCCSGANNHILDWGHGGLTETLKSPRRSGIATAGGGNNLQEACAPAILEVPLKGRVIVVALAHRASGVPRSWAARASAA